MKNSDDIIAKIQHQPPLNFDSVHSPNSPPQIPPVISDSHLNKLRQPTIIKPDVSKIMSERKEVEKVKHHQQPIINDQIKAPEISTQKQQDL